MEVAQCGGCGCDPGFSQDKVSLLFFLEFPMIPTHRSEDPAWAAEKDHQSLQAGKQRRVQTLDLVIPFLVIFSKELKKRKIQTASGHRDAQYDVICDSKRRPSSARAESHCDREGHVYKELT